MDWSASGVKLKPRWKAEDNPHAVKSEELQRSEAELQEGAQASEKCGEKAASPRREEELGTQHNQHTARSYRGYVSADDDLRLSNERAASPPSDKERTMLSCGCPTSR